MGMILKKHVTIFIVTLTLALLASLTVCGPAKAKLTSNKLTSKRYDLARARYNMLLFSPQDASVRENWLGCIQAFRQSYKTDPYHTLAPSSLLTLGHMYFQMFKKFGKKEDLSESLAYYDDVVSLFPQHSFADDALYKTAQIYVVELKDYKNAGLVFARLIALYPRGDMVRKAANDLKKLKSGAAESQAKRPRKIVTALATKKSPAFKRTKKNKKEPVAHAEVVTLRHWSTDNYTRVVIETSKPIQYKGHLLKKDGNKPRRLYVNLANSRIDKKLQKAIPIKDGFLQRVRSAQYAPETVRVVLDTISLSDYKIFTLDDPFRIVIDVKGVEPLEKAPPTKVVQIPNAPSLAQQLGLGIKRVILDPGHGGKDPGAIGYQGLREKDVVLKVAKKVARKITKELGIEVVLTRKRDRFLPLEERTAIANTKNGDLFISIHANAAETKQANGIETYYLDLAVTEGEMQIAAKENATSARKISDLQKILSHLMNNTKKDESARLASIVQTSLMTGLSTKYKIRDHGVKKAPFIVLIGAQMPSVLTEIAFLTNPTEATRLRNDKYLEEIADHITEGIVKYAMLLNMASL